MKKRIVIDATPLLYTETGIGRVTRSLINEIRAINTDFDIRLFARRFEGEALRNLISDMRVTHLRLPRSAEYFIKALHLVELNCRGDLYHATDFYLPLAKPERCVATLHDMIFMAQPEQMVDHQRLREWVPDFVKKCRRLIAVSEFSKQDAVRLLDIDPARIDVVYNGVDSDVFYPEPDSDELRQLAALLTGTQNPFFLAVSCSTGRKNTSLLLDVYGEFLSHHPRHDLVLVWNPPEEVRARVATFRYAERIHFTGRVDDRGLRCLYNRASAVLYPSLYEGFGLPVVEAMSCGTSVITSHNSSLPEVGGDAAIYVDPVDRNSIHRVLELFENNPGLPAELHEKNIRQAARFSWNRCARETLAVYRRCLEM